MSDWVDEETDNPRYERRSKAGMRANYLKFNLYHFLTPMP